MDPKIRSKLGLKPNETPSQENRNVPCVDCGAMVSKSPYSLMSDAIMDAVTMCNPCRDAWREKIGWKSGSTKYRRK